MISVKEVLFNACISEGEISRLSGNRELLEEKSSGFVTVLTRIQIPVPPL